MKMFEKIKSFVTEKSALVAEAIGAGILVITIVIMGAILQGVQNTQSATVAGNTGYNLSTQGLTAFTTFGTFFSLIILVVVGAYLIRLLGFFGNSSGGL